MTRVALLWHMHQPFYQDLVSGEHILPWVRLHAIKDYWGMVALLREFPDVKVTFNLVPSMLVQLEAFARDEARDRHLALGLKPAAHLSDEERAFCVEQFFHAQAERMIAPYPRYAELLARRGGPAPAGDDGRARASQFGEGELRDLQVWHKLAWIDPVYLDQDARIRTLLDKGRDFTEEDKGILREVELEILRRVIPEYRDAAARDQIELSTSPFYHPILPLLCDTDVYHRTHPQSRMPRRRFAHPEDAREQLMRAVTLHEQLFGNRPVGLWPSEGSISDAMVPLVAEAGFEWMATDEEILARTRGVGFSRGADGHVEQASVLYRPYRVGVPGKDVACGFRDHTLSDLIGFSYASWEAEAAADDFVGRLAEAGRRYHARNGGGEATIFIILDGENAWEHYPGQGRPFLRALYGRLSGHPELQAISMSQACRPATEQLPSVFPGSWINADFYIWIGHPDDHRAWSQLADAREALDAPHPGVPGASVDRAREELLIAEGSDWFWWYGDDHSSDHDAEFDALFRRHVQNVYRALDRPIPDELFVTNISTGPTASTIERPTGFIRPVIDGEITSYFEWVGAGCVELNQKPAGAMHQVATASRPTRIEFGFDLDHLFVRVTAESPMKALVTQGASVAVSFLSPGGYRVTVDPSSPEGARLGQRLANGRLESRPCPGTRAAIGAVMELQIPFGCLDVRPGDTVEFVLEVRGTAPEAERHPGRPIGFVVPDRNFAAVNWTA